MTGTYGTLTINADGTYTYTPGQGGQVVGASGGTIVLSDPAQVTQGTATGPVAYWNGNHIYVATTFVAGETGTYEFSQPVIPADTVLHVYAGSFDPSSPGTNRLAYNDDAGGSLRPRLSVDLTEGETYTVVISNWNPADSFGLPLTVYTDGPGVFGGVPVDPDTLDDGDVVTDTFTYTVSDGDAVDTGTITVTITGANDAPVAGGDDITTTEDSGFSGVLPGSDIDGDALTYAIGNPPANGTITAFDESTGSYTYTPDADDLPDGQTRTDTFTYTVFDGDETVEGTVNVIITGVNDAPLAGSATLATGEDTPLNGTLPGSDVDGNTLTYTITQNPTNGTITSFDPTTGAYTYVSNQDLDDNETRMETIKFTVFDGTATSAEDTVTITVTGANDAAVAVDDILSTDADTAKTITVADLTGNDIDVDIEPLRVAIVEEPGRGTLVRNLDGSFTYTPEAGFTGADTFKYSVYDGDLLDATPATVTINVGPSLEGLLSMTGTPVTGDVTLTGDTITMAISPDGTLLNSSNTVGLVFDGQEFVTWGTPVWNHTVSYDSQNFANGSGFSSVTREDISSGTFHGYKITATVGSDLLMERVIGFYDGEDYFIIATRLTNTGNTTLTHVATLENTDPDQGVAIGASVLTSDDVVVAGDFVRSHPTASSYPGGLTLGFGSADPRAVVSAEGFSNTDPFAIINSPEDPNGTEGDRGINLAMNYGSLAPGQSVTGGMVVVVGTSTANADQTYQDAAGITDQGV
jgi:VCBS repeat-containing protein